MKRRDFIGLLGGAAVWPLVALAQTSDRMRRVAALFPLAESDPEQAARRAMVRDTLQQLGWIDGKTVQLDFRFAGTPDRFAPLAREIVAREPDVIFAQTPGAVAAIKRETQAIPVVFANVSDPIGAGFVGSLARPGGSITGIQLFEASIASKWLSTLKEVSPSLKRVALMANPRTTAYDYFLQIVEAAAPSLDVAVTASRIAEAAEITHAIETLAAGKDGGLLLAPDSTNLRNRDLIIGLAARHRIPVVYPERNYVAAGGLVSYGIADLVEPFRQGAAYVDRILRGAKPADLPVQAPTRYATVLNLRTAKAAGFALPPSLLLAADEVIE